MWFVSRQFVFPAHVGSPSPRWCGSSDDSMESFLVLLGFYRFLQMLFLPRVHERHSLRHSFQKEAMMAHDAMIVQEMDQRSQTNGIRAAVVVFNEFLSNLRGSLVRCSCVCWADWTCSIAPFQIQKVVWLALFFRFLLPTSEAKNERGGHRMCEVFLGPLWCQW